MRLRVVAWLTRAFGTFEIVCGEHCRTVRITGFAKGKDNENQATANAIDRLGEVLSKEAAELVGANETLGDVSVRSVSSWQHDSVSSSGIPTPVPQSARDARHRAVNLFTTVIGLAEIIGQDVQGLLQEDIRQLSEAARDLQEIVITRWQRDAQR